MNTEKIVEVNGTSSAINKYLLSMNSYELIYTTI